ncbi:unnamed protein product [Merluccius merluccius]
MNTKNCYLQEEEEEERYVAPASSRFSLRVCSPSLCPSGLTHKAAGRWLTDAGARPPPLLIIIIIMVSGDHRSSEIPCHVSLGPGAPVTACGRGEAWQGSWWRRGCVPAEEDARVESHFLHASCLLPAYFLPQRTTKN